MKLSKNQLVLIAMAITLHLLTSCSKSLTGIKGEGPIITEEISLPEISGINLSAAGNIYVSYSEEQSVIIKSHQNIIDNMEWDYHDNNLDIDFDKNVRDYETLDIYISVKNLESLGLSGSGEIKTTSYFNSDNAFSAKLSGSGNISMDVDAPEIYLNTSGSGDINLYTRTNYISGKISGTGDFSLSGSSKSSYYNISGSGSISAFGLNCKSSDLNISGSGDVDLFVSDALKVNISGSGDVHYKGWPTIKKDISGSGKVSSAN